MSSRFIRSKIVCMLAAIWVALSGLQATAPLAYGQGKGWSQPLRLSSSHLSSWWPDLTTDALGNIHVVWAATDSGYDLVMYTTSLNGQEWSEPTDVAALEQGPNGESAATRPTVLVDDQGMVHLTFVNTTIYYARAAATAVYNANTWSPTRALSGSETAYFSRLATDHKGTLHLVFTENVPSAECNICLHVFYRQSNDHGSTWSAPIDISYLPTGSAKPQILIDKQDNIHVVWESGRGGLLGHVVDPSKVMYTASRDGGQTWLPPTELGLTDHGARNISIASAGAGQLVVVWLGLPEDLVYYQISRDLGRSWSTPQFLPGVSGGTTVYATRLDNYAMASDSTGTIHLTLVGRLTPDQMSLSVFHLTWNGSAWSEPEALTTMTGDVPEWPRIAVDKYDQLHVTWFVRDQAHIWDQEGSDYSIWYTRKPALAQRTGATWPTPEPKASPQMIATLAATPTTQPIANDPSPATSIDSLYTEIDDLQLLARVLIPVVVLMVGVFVIVNSRRH